MDRRFIDVLEGKEKNYLLPFFWQQGNHTELLPKQIAEIQAGGCDAFCVESRTHEDFAGDGWWRDMDIMLAEAEKRGMQVWILDDKHFPTGYCNGLAMKKYPERRNEVLIEDHVDVFGPMKGVTLLCEENRASQSLVAAVALRHSGKGTIERDAGFLPEAIDLTSQVKPPYLHWDVPEGFWRVFFIYRTREKGGNFENVNMIHPQAGETLIEAVYEPHYARYSRYFGTTLAGFFSDEPQFQNNWFGPHWLEKGYYGRKVGERGLALPFVDDILPLLEEKTGIPSVNLLPAIWYDVEEYSPIAREAYMDIVSRLYKENFCDPLGKWCREHNCEYIGHIIEDMNGHAHLSCSGGHFFRSLDGQTMAGMDIVLHQVMPGFADYITTSTLSIGNADPKFFQYSLAKLAASHAHINLKMQGRAMCEVFGAFGWAESVPFMKWLMDFLLVRGINRFVPHAFSPNFPNPDCPPHFGNLGQDPSFAGFRTLMDYTNRMAHILEGATHKAEAAVLYHAEDEWFNQEGDFAFEDDVTKALTQAHIDFDIVPVDYLSTAELTEGEIRIGSESYKALVIPWARKVPECVKSLLERLHKAGIPLIFQKERPEGIFYGEALPEEKMGDYFREKGWNFLEFSGGEYVRHYLCSRDEEGTGYLMLFNESTSAKNFTLKKFPFEEPILECRPLDGTRHMLERGQKITLLPNESTLLVFCKDAEKYVLEPPMPQEKTAKQCILDSFSLCVAGYEDLNRFALLSPKATPGNVQMLPGMENFGGILRYETVLSLEKQPKAFLLDAGEVHEILTLCVNGTPLETKIASPYRYCFTEKELALLHVGDNILTLEVGTTLGAALRDSFSQKMFLTPIGLQDPVRVVYED